MLVPVLVGAVIGYITNYLAIRMLFRPLETKYLFGKPLPFTPGLIPKERDRLAARTGQAVKAYLLTEEAVLTHLESSNVPGRMETAIRNFLTREADKDTAIGEVLAQRLEITPASVAPLLGRFLVKNRWFGWADAQTAKSRVETYLAGKMHNERWAEPVIDRLKALFTRTVAEGTLDTTAADALLALFAEKEGQTLEEALPEPLLLGLLAQYNEREEELVVQLKRLLLSARMTATVRAAAQDTAEQHMARPLRVFLRPEGIGSRVAEAYIAYLESEESTVLLKENLRGAVDTLLHTNVTDLLRPVTKEKTAAWAREGLEGLVLLIHKEGVNDRLCKVLHTHADTLSETAAGLVSGMLADSLQKRTEAQAAAMTEPLLQLLFETKTADVLKSFGDDAPQRLAQKAADLLRKALPGMVKDGVARFGVDKLVEEQIKRFDVKMLEEVIVDVADRELKAITNLGALLGAIMGLIQPLLQRLL